MDNEPLQIDLDKIVKSKFRKGKGLPKFVMNYLKRTIHQEEINAYLKESSDLQGVDFATDVKRFFEVDCDVYGLENIPKDKKFIFVSNHPLGGMDGILLISILGKYFDGKIKAQVNDLLMNIKPLAPCFIPVNCYGKQSKGLAKNLDDVMGSDNQLLVFPAGMCSRRQNGKILDLQWKKWFVTNAVSQERDVVPIFFNGKNSKFFYNFASIREKLGIKFNIELIYLPDELFKSKGKKYEIYFGKPIPWQTFNSEKTPKEWAQYVKNLVYEIKK
ncbi:MAG: 1-acyl-sn-glycerol-3-phosphate acyltransferase [Bacteroidales bacterium]|nr:1-acyl-sn-glycerol-3-phosphate acyltransferase [Bacteroidales bacterium]